MAAVAVLGVGVVAATLLLPGPDKVAGGGRDDAGLGAQKADTADVPALIAAANQGDASAQVALGKLYLHGAPGLAEDRERARDSFARAAAQGNPIGAYYMSTLTKDPAEAARWLEKAADAGVAQAMFLLGNAYRAGSGVPQDPAKALAWYQRAAERDHAAALQTLAMAYLRGELGLTPDESEYRHYEMEAEHALQHPQPLP